MSDAEVWKLAEKCYAHWRSQQVDPSAHEYWGNLDTQVRIAWVGSTKLAYDAGVLAGINEGREEWLSSEGLT